MRKIYRIEGPVWKIQPERRPEKRTSCYRGQHFGRMRGSG